MSNQATISMVQTAQDAEELASFFKAVWGGQDDVVPFDLQLALIHVGAYASLATLNNHVVGGSFGVRGEFAGQTLLHSHVTAATVSGVGWQLKQHQADWARARGLGAITWTFDPLVRRNCVFNFEKLGAEAIEYLPNFYGTMTDDINRGDESDRLFLRWNLNSSNNPNDLPIEAMQNIAIKNLSGLPLVQEFDQSKSFAVELPADIESLRSADLKAALAWRAAVRDVLQPAMANNGRISQMSVDRTALIIEF